MEISEDEEGEVTEKKKIEKNKVCSPLPSQLNQYADQCFTSTNCQVAGAKRMKEKEKET